MTRLDYTIINRILKIALLIPIGTLQLINCKVKMYYRVNVNIVLEFYNDGLKPFSLQNANK